MRNSAHVSLPLAVTLGLVASLALAGVVHAAEVTLTADLAGVSEGENPGDEDGTGSAMIVLDPDTGEACWELTVENIEPVTQSHIHVGAEGESGDVVVPLDVDGFEGSSEGCVSDQDADTLQAIVDDSTGYYVNVHTADFPAGAIRGQLVGASEPPDTALPITDRPTGLLGLLLVAVAVVAIGLRAARPIATRD